MKSTLLSILFVTLLATWTLGQITINDSTFPDEMDTVATYSVANPAIDIMAESLGELDWDFSSLDKTNYNSYVYQNSDKSEDAESFPGAELFVSREGIELFYDVRASEVVELGLSGIDPIIGVTEISSAYSGGRITHRAPLKYGNSYSSTFGLEVAQPVSELPEEYQNQLALLGADSIRVVLDVDQNDEADAYGKLRLRKDTYDVLRVKNTRYTDTRVDIYSSIFGWIELSAENIPIDNISSVLGKDTLTTYQFWANNEKAPIAEVTYDTDNKLVSGITFKYENELSSVEDIKDQEVVAYPNPTYGDLNVELKNYPKDNYTLEVYNIIGKKILTRKFRADSLKLSTDLGELKKGTYLYSILNGQGKKITTKRLMIITP